jgi:hypothetical protein
MGVFPEIEAKVHDEADCEATSQYHRPKPIVVRSWWWRAEEASGSGERRRRVVVERGGGEW